MLLIAAYILFVIAVSIYVQINLKPPKYIKLLLWSDAVLVVAIPAIANLWHNAYVNYFWGNIDLGWLFNGTLIGLILYILELLILAVYVFCVIKLKFNPIVKVITIILVAVFLFYFYDGAVYETFLPLMGL